MKSFIVGALIAAAPCAAGADGFLRELPEPALLRQLTAEKFKNADAVIILKEQAFTVHHTTIEYRGFTLTGLSTTTTEILIVKLFNAAAVEHYGSFELLYAERFGNEIRTGAVARARALKLNGTVVEMPEDEVQTLVAEESSDGTPRARKLVFKVPDLQADDVVQIEYTLTEPLVQSLTGIFYYNERDPILWSNLAITLPEVDHVRFFSFPQRKVGEPKAEQISDKLGAGLTYFWSVKNLNGIPDEPFGIPFGDQSLKTAFVVDRKEFDGGPMQMTDWNTVVAHFVSTELNKNGVGADQKTDLGFTLEPTNISFRTVDSLYARLRKTFTLLPFNSLYPASDKLSELFERKRGTASDIAYIMQNILQQWHQDARFLWIRDRRQGTFETTVPSTSWFDRLGVVVHIGNEEKVYDFDRSVPFRYELPWYLERVQTIVLAPEGAQFKTLHGIPSDDRRYIRERHALNIDTSLAVSDTMTYACRGAQASAYRSDWYDLLPDVLRQRFRSIATNRCINAVDSAFSNNWLEEPEIALRFTGSAKIRAERIDTFLTVGLRNEALRSFRDELYSARRVGDVSLQEPLTISVDWDVRGPSGYELYSCPDNRTLTGPMGVQGATSMKQQADVLFVHAEIVFRNPLIPVDRYKELVRVVDDLIRETEKTVVFRKPVKRTVGRREPGTPPRDESSR